MTSGRGETAADLLADIESAVNMHCEGCMYPDDPWLGCVVADARRLLTSATATVSPPKDSYLVGLEAVAEAAREYREFVRPYAYPRGSKLGEALDEALAEADRVAVRSGDKWVYDADIYAGPVKPPPVRSGDEPA